MRWIKACLKLDVFKRVIGASWLWAGVPVHLQDLLSTEWVSFSLLSPSQRALPLSWPCILLLAMCPHVAAAEGAGHSFPALTVGWLLLQGAFTPHSMGGPIPPRPPGFWSVGASQKTGAFPSPWKRCSQQTLGYPIVHIPRFLSWEGTPKFTSHLAAGGGLSSSPSCMVPPS